ncbi:MAG: hypothetical protein U0168_12270 [Nannocystaceae bacterium]
MVAGSVACSDGPVRQTGGAGGGAGGSAGGSAGDADAFDYGVCEGVNGDLECEQFACAEDEQGLALAETLRDVIAEEGMDDVATIRRISLYPGSDQLFVDVHLQVAWYRRSESFESEISETTEALRQSFAQWLAGQQLPEHVVDPEVISAAMKRCDPILVYDPCTDNFTGTMAHAQYDGEAPGCTPWATYAEVDVTTGELLQCVIHEEYGCE